MSATNPTTGASAPAPHSHGAGELPISRIDVHGSFDVTAFPVPNGREEEWRFTPLRRLRGLHQDTAADQVAGSDVGVEASTPDGVSVQTVGRDDARLGTSFLPTDRISARAYASCTEATVLTVPKETEVAEPATLRITGSGGQSPERQSFGHTLISVERHAVATVVLDYSGSAVYGDNVEIVLGDGAKLTLISLQDWERGSVHVSHQYARIGRDATLRSFSVTLGGDLVRVSPSVRYDGPGGDAELRGLYFTGAGQHHEHRSLIDHNVSRTRSRADYKGALSGEDAHAVWIGDVIIGEGTEGTDSYEHNHNLVLTDGTRVDSVPNLEIFTGEVEGAGHASASGRLDDVHLFYLKSRGIPENQARRLVIRGFFDEFINRIELPQLRERISDEVEEKLAEHE